MLADRDRLYVEARDSDHKTASFSCLDVPSSRWLLEDKVFEEPWWVSLGAASGDIVLLTVYTGTDNPDKKSVIAFNVVNGAIIWWRNGFSLAGVVHQVVQGNDARSPEREITLDLFTGNPVQPADSHLADSQNFAVIRPFQYEEGTAHFNTVRDFLHSRVGIVPVQRIEYLENDELIVISVFVRENELANYLIVFDSDGNFLLREKLGDNLKGIALDTFFVFSGHLIFIKDKKELRAYKIL